MPDPQPVAGILDVHLNTRRGQAPQTPMSFRDAAPTGLDAFPGHQRQTFTQWIE